MATVPTKAKDALCWHGIGVVVLTAGLYIASCFRPATDIGTWNELAYPGWVHLVGGWVDWPNSFPAWSANFVLWVASWCLLRSRYGAAAALGITAALLGLSTMTCYKHDGRYVGYYLWQASQFVLAVGAVVAYCWSRRHRVTA